MIELWKIKKSKKYYSDDYYEYVLTNSNNIMSAGDELNTVIEHYEGVAGDKLNQDDYNIYEKINEFETIGELREYYIELLI